MATSSGQAGYLPPATSPSYGDPLDDLFHDFIAGITEIPGNLVRPRWQPEPPTQPDFNVNWVAFGITSAQPDKFMYARHDPSAGPEGSSFIERDELLTVLISFYGPQSMDYAMRLIDGIEVGQNRADLSSARAEIRYTNDPVIVPALLKEKWVKRVDVPVIVSRRTSRRYAVNTIASGQLGLDNESWVTPINVNQP